MATLTAILGLRKPDPTDLVNVLTDLDANLDTLDVAVGINQATTTRIKENRVATLESRANAAYGALATAQNVTVTPGPSGLIEITLGCLCGNGTAGGSSLMSVVLSGGNVRAAADDIAVGAVSGVVNQSFWLSRTSLLTGLNAAATVFTVQYRSAGVDLASFSHRQLIVKAL